MGLPKVNAKQSNGNLGRTEPSEDGITLIIGNAGAAPSGASLGDVIGPIRSPQGAIDLGIDAAYDTAQNSQMYQHVADFFADENNSIGTELYLMIVADSVTMEDMADKTEAYAFKGLNELAGKVRRLVITRQPGAGYTPSYTDGLDNDIIACFTKLKELRTHFFDKGMPFSAIVEGRDIQTPYASLKDLRDAAGVNGNRIAVVIAQDKAVAGLNTHFEKSAMAGYLAGKLAGRDSVAQNAGRVKSGAVKAQEAVLSNNQDIKTVLASDDTVLDTLHDLGYIVLRQHPNRAGWYFNDDPVAAPLSDDYAYISDGDVADKATRIAIDVYTEELNDDFNLNNDGTLSPGYLKDFQETLEDNISRVMVAGNDISNVEVFVDPAQNVASTSEIETELNLFKRGTGRKITVTVGFKVATS